MVGASPQSSPAYRCMDQWGWAEGRNMGQTSPRGAGVRHPFLTHGAKRLPTARSRMPPQTENSTGLGQAGEGEGSAATESLKEGGSGFAHSLGTCPPLSF